MKKRIINTRSIVYSCLGIITSTTFVFSLLLQIPPVPSSRTDVLNFEGGTMTYEREEENGHKEENSNKGSVTVKDITFGDNVHMITSEIKENLKNQGVFSLGKANPMLFNKGGGASNESTPVDIEIPETPAKEPEPQATGIKLETPDGTIHLEYTSGKLPVEKSLYKVDKIYGMVGEKFNYGIEIRSEGMANKEVTSVLPGIVSNVGSSEEYGNYVVVNHGTVSSLYSRLNAPARVKIGDRVFMGDAVGYIEASDDPHLYFEMDVDGVRFNPEIFINAIKGD